MILLDTNIILRLKQTESAEHQAVQLQLKTFLENGETSVLSPQNIFEFYSVATRPIGVNGLGLSVEDTYQEIQGLKSLFSILPDNKNLMDKWLKLVLDYEIKGKRSHDVRLIAFMQSHQIKKLYTLNHADFKAFEGIIELV